MFKKLKLKRAIEASKKRIAELEQKRTRSQAALIEAILNHTSPDDGDVDYFNMFTEQIEQERANLHQLQAELKELG